MVYARFFLPDSAMVWYAMEGEPVGNDFWFFGVICGPEGCSYGYFHVAGLDREEGPMGKKVERDMSFLPRCKNEILELKELL